MKLRFYLKYLTRLMLNEKSHSFMTIIAIAAGVAVLGAITMLSKGVQENLTRDVLEYVGADIIIKTNKEPFKGQHLKQFEELKKNGTITDFSASATYQDFVGNGSTETLAAYWFVDHKNYPLYGKSPVSVSPKAQDMTKLLDKGVILSKRIASKLNVKPGDRVSFGIEPVTYVVSGIVGDEIQPSLDMRVTGFIVRPLSQLREAVKHSVQINDMAATEIKVKINSAENISAARKAIESVSPKFISMETADTVKKTLKEIMEVVHKGDNAFGFMIFLIVGIGIGYSANLWARRRLHDMAILKSLGLKEKEVRNLFILALAIFSFAGSLIGLPFSLFFVMLLQNFARIFVGISGSFYWFYPAELIAVITVTFLVITAFSIAPVISLGKTLPASSLRTEEGRFPAFTIAGRFAASALSVVVLFFAAFIIIRDTVVAAQVLAGSLAVGVVLITVLRLVFRFLPARLPLGNSYKMAVRSIKSQGWASPKTALVIMVGVLSLSLVLVVSENFKTGLASEISKQAGHDAIIVVPPEVKIDADKIIDKVPGGLSSKVKGSVVSVDLSSINGDSKRLDRALGKNIDSGQNADPYIFDQIKRLSLMDMSSYKPWQAIDRGRDINQSDSNAKVIVISGRIARSLNIKLGDTMDFELNGLQRKLSLKVIGITNYSQITTTYTMVTPENVFSNELLEGNAAATSYYVNFNKDSGKSFEWLDARLNKVVMLNISQFMNAFAEVIDNLRVFPFMISALSVICSVVIIWNSVTLSAIQRRREFAILRSLGAKSRKLVWILTSEHMIIGLISGFIALTVVLAITNLVSAGMFKEPPTFNYWTMLIVVIMPVAVATAAGLIPAIQMARARPMEVLRNE